MGDQQQCALIVFQVILQPHHRLEVQVVGRLVQNQQVRFFQQQPCDGKPCFLTAAEAGDDAGVVFPSESHTVQYRANLHVDLVAVVRLEPRLQPVVFLGDREVAGLHLFLQGVHFLLRIQERLEHASHFLPDGTLPIQPAHLLQIADAGLPGIGDIAVPFHQMIRQFMLRDDAQQRGFSAAVHADQSDAVPILDGEGNMGEHLISIVKFIDIC